MALLAEIAAKEGTIVPKAPTTTTVKTSPIVKPSASGTGYTDTGTKNTAAVSVTPAQAVQTTSPTASAQAQATANAVQQVEQRQVVGNAWLPSGNEQPLVNGLQPNVNAGADELAKYATPTQQAGMQVAGQIQPSVVPKPSQQRGITDTGTGTPSSIVQPVQDEIDAQISPDLSKVTSGGTGTSVKTSGTGTGVAGGGVATGGTTTTLGMGEAGATPNQTSMQLLKEIQTDQFAYDSAADEQYRIAASNLENEVAQMMVGRGGLYSSVAASALQNRLIALQVQFRQSAYEEFLQERSFKMDMAKFVADREDAAFSKEMALAEYNLNVQQQQFSQWMQKQNLALQQAQFSYRKQQDALQAQISNQRSALESSIAGWQNQDSQYNAMMDKWKNSNYGYATADVAAYFGVKQNAQYSRSSNAIAIKRSTLNQQQQSLTQQSVELGYADITAGALQGWYEESTKSYNVDKDPVVQLGDTRQQNEYFSANSKYQTSVGNNTLTAQQVANDLQLNYNSYVSKMGSMLAQKLYNEWVGLAQSKVRSTALTE